MVHLLVQWRGKESNWEIEVVSVLCVVSQQAVLKPGANIFILYKQSEIEARMAKIIKVSENVNKLKQMQIDLTIEQRYEEIRKLEKLFITIGMKDECKKRIMQEYEQEKRTRQTKWVSDDDSKRCRKFFIRIENDEEEASSDSVYEEPSYNASESKARNVPMAPAKPRSGPSRGEPSSRATESRTNDIPTRPTEPRSGPSRGETSSRATESKTNDKPTSSNQHAVRRKRTWERNKNNSSAEPRSGPLKEESRCRCATVDRASDKPTSHAQPICISSDTEPSPSASAPDGGNLEMVVLGSGSVSVPVGVLESLAGTSYVTATEKLLEAVFTRDVLATHTLRGIPTRTGSHVHNQLNPQIIKDVVCTIKDMGAVHEDVVISCILQYCAKQKVARRRLKLEKRKKNPLKYSRKKHEKSILSRLSLTSSSE